jgi:hypothetical protein
VYPLLTQTLEEHKPIRIQLFLSTYLVHLQTSG